jgi:tRNA threonylcarbamoyladenosine biosynthesis protein TsaB
MKILAIDTATEACSAALLLDGAVTERFVVQPRGHGELILGMMDELLSEAGLAVGELDALAFGRGPGAFTGVRIGTGVAQGTAFAADLPLLPVSNLAALAHRCYREQGASRVLAALDARMGEVYWGIYECRGLGQVTLLGEELVAGPDALPPLPPGEGWQAAGHGWDSYGDALKARMGMAPGDIHPGLLCSAHDIVLLGAADYGNGKTVPAEAGLPVYLRDKVAVKKAV